MPMSLKTTARRVLTSIFGRNSGDGGAGNRPPRPNSFRPRLEALEVRDVPATLIWVGGADGFVSTAAGNPINQTPGTMDTLEYGTGYGTGNYTGSPDVACALADNNGAAFLCQNILTSGYAGTISEAGGNSITCAGGTTAPSYISPSTTFQIGTATLNLGVDATIATNSSNATVTIVGNATTGGTWNIQNLTAMYGVTLTNVAANVVAGAQATNHGTVQFTTTIGSFNIAGTLNMSGSPSYVSYANVQQNTFYQPLSVSSPGLLNCVAPTSITGYINNSGITEVYPGTTLTVQGYDAVYTASYIGNPGSNLNLEGSTITSSAIGGSTGKVAIFGATAGIGYLNVYTTSKSIINASVLLQGTATNAAELKFYDTTGVG
jgi:hypothetical protein